jgi:trimethylamine--corrinoid protein Co-methyltransferase
LENTLAVSYEKILVDNEIIDMARRFAQGMGVNAETLAVDVIKQVGCGPHGKFLQHDHTFDHFRSEQFIPDLFVRDVYSNWERFGKQTVEQRAAAQLGDVLANHQPLPLPEDALKEIDAIYQAAEKAALNN